MNMNTELRTIEDVADYQRALIMAFEAGEITETKLNAGMSASKALLETFKAIKADEWEFPFGEGGKET